MPDPRVPESMLAALRQAWTAVRVLNVPAALMGGIALASWKYPRATRDIDLLVGIADLRPERLVEILRAFGLAPSAPIRLSIWVNSIFSNSFISRRNRSLISRSTCCWQSRRITGRPSIAAQRRCAWPIWTWKSTSFPART